MHAELEQLQDEISHTPDHDFDRLSELLTRRGEMLKNFQPTQEDRELLMRMAEESRQMQIRIQAERRRLCLDAGSLRNQQRILDAML
jgi:hypothetical protein